MAGSLNPVEIGCERGWRRAQLRSELGIPHTVPWIATLWLAEPFSMSDSAIPDRTTIDRQLHLLTHELRWMVPGLRVGILNLCGEFFEHPNDGSVPCRLSEPFQVHATTRDPSSLLDWACAVDAWISMDASPISRTMERIAATLQLPFFSIPPGQRSSGSSTSTESGPSHGIAHSIARSLKFRTQDPSMMAFKLFRDRLANPRLGTVEGAQAELIDAYRSMVQPMSPDFAKVPQRRAA